MIFYKSLCPFAFKMLASCSPAVIAKILSTLTVHRVASCYPLHPKFAFWTLLKFGSFGKDHKSIICFLSIDLFFVLVTSQSIMILAATPQAIIFQTDSANILGNVSIKLEDNCASCSWTPGNRLCVLLYIFIEREYFILFF